MFGEQEVDGIKNRYKSPWHLGYINKYSHNMLHLFNNDLNFSTKLLLEPVYLKVCHCYNGHGTYTAPESAIFSHQHLCLWLLAFQKVCM